MALTSCRMGEPFRPVAPLETVTNLRRDPLTGLALMRQANWLLPGCPEGVVPRLFKSSNNLTKASRSLANMSVIALDLAPSSY